MHRVFARKVIIFSLLISLIGLFYYPLKLTNAVPGSGSSVYRYWSDAYKSHFYTTSIVEKMNIENNMPEWQYESVAYYVLPAGTSPGP